MGYTLRPYQADATGRGVEFMLTPKKKQRNGVIYIPTGGGKSLCIGTTAIELSATAPVIVFQPTKEILEQNYEKIRSYGFQAEIFSASLGKRDIGTITTATIGSVYKHPEWFEDFQFGLIDECHLTSLNDNSNIVRAGEGNEFYHRDLGLVHELENQEGVGRNKVRVIDEDGVENVIPLPKKSMFKAFFEILPHMRWLGYSASPYRLVSNAMGSQLKVVTRTRPRIWDEFIHWTQYKELFDAGYLAKVEYYQIPGFKKSQIKINSSGSDFDAHALQLCLWEKLWASKGGRSVNFPDKLTEVVSRALDAGRRNALIFTASVREAEYLADQMKGDCVVITGDTGKDERRQIGTDFRSGKIKTVVNCGVWVHGFDFPGLECLVDAAPSMSLARYDQKLGRLVRRDPSNDQKVGWAIDMVEGYKQFGPLEARMLYCEGSSKWDVFGRPGGGEEARLTTTYLAGALAGCCSKCQAPKFIAFYEGKGKYLPISLPPPGTSGNLVIEQDGKRKKCRTVERGKGTHVFHFAYCDKFAALKWGKQ